MWCPANKCTMSTQACIERRLKAKTKTYKKYCEENYKKCLTCLLGSQVNRRPERFINRDVQRLKLKQFKDINERGFVFKEEIHPDENVINNWKPRKNKNELRVANLKYSNNK